MISRLFFGFTLLFVIVGRLCSQGVVIDHWESVVYASDNWRYYFGLNSGPAAGWHTSGFNDESWLQGPGGFGYADGDDQTTLAVPPNPTAVYIRTPFQILDTAEINMALLNMDFDDGFVTWINGVEVARANLGTPGDFPAYNTPATDHEALMYQNLNPPAFLISKQKLATCLMNGMNTLAIQVNNTGSSSSDMSCIPFLSVAMKSAGTSYRPLPSWFYEPYTGFTGSHLPLVIIQTSAPIQSDVKVMVDLGIIDNGPGNINHLTDPWNNYNGKAGIEYRGSSSMMFPKRNYGFETWTPEGLDTAYSLLGMPAESDWVLHGPYSDKSLMRNYLAFYLFNAMGYYAPQTRLCEMFLDGQYHGVYLLLEKIKRDKNRVNISKLLPTDVIGDQLTGGYIVKIDRSATDYTDGWFSPIMGTGTGNSGPFFAYHYPRRTEIVPKQEEYIRNRITNFEMALIGSNYRDPYAGYRAYIDVPSFINYFILVELSKNTDGYRLSTFLYKDRDGKDPLIHMGPVWDYDLAFGNADYLEAFNTFGWNYTVPADGWGTPFWWSRLLSDSYYANNLNCYWNYLRQDLLSNDALMALVDSTAEAIGAAVERNFNQWPIHGVYIWPNPYVGNTYQQDINYMKNWIRDRAEWIDANIPGVYCTTGIKEAEESFNLSLKAYPNPAFGVVTLEIQNVREDELLLEVYNITGQLVLSSTLGREPLHTKKITLQAGLYTARVTNGNDTETVKIIVQ